MTTAFQDPVSSQSLALGDAWAVTASHEIFHAMPQQGTTERYFGGVAPVCQYDRGAPRWIDRAAAIRLWPESNPLRELHRFDSVITHGPQMMDRTGIIDDKSTRPLTRPAFAQHLYSARRELAERILGPLAVQDSAPKLDPVSQWFDSSAKPVVFLERARRLLNKQRIREARDVLQLGSASYPEDEKIAVLLRAISPGQVKRSRGCTPSREQEMDWLQKHGHRFRGQWVALRGDNLVASAGTLDELIAEVKRLSNDRIAPVIQKIASN